MGLFEPRERLMQTERDLILKVPGQPRVSQCFLSRVPFVGFDLRDPAKEILCKPSVGTEYLSERGTNLTLLIFRLYSSVLILGS